MEKVNYIIKTVDGHVVRKKATRPYVAGWVVRDTDVVVAHEMTTQPKTLIGTKDIKWGGHHVVYEELVATPITKKVRG